MMSAQQQKRRKRRKWGRHSLLSLLSSGATATHTEALLPGKWLDITCWWELKNKSFGFSSSVHDLCLCFIKLTLSMRFFPSYFLPPCLAEKGSERVTWWVPGIQPRSTHHTTTHSTDFVTVIHDLKLRTICSLRNFPTQGERRGLTAVSSLLSEVHPKLSKGQRNPHANKIVAESSICSSTDELLEQLCLVLSCLCWTNEMKYSSVALS